jgi:hypothetical protein
VNNERKDLLSLTTLPARLNCEEAANFLGFQPHDIPILISRGLLKPLGRPAHNGPKYFLTATLEDLRRDEKWFARASDAIVQYWRGKNSRKNQNGVAVRNHRLSRRNGHTCNFTETETDSESL